MSRNLGAKNPLRRILQVSFFENHLSAKVTIFIVLVSLLLGVAHGDKDLLQQDDDIRGLRHVSQPDLIMKRANGLLDDSNDGDFVRAAGVGGGGEMGAAAAAVGAPPAAAAPTSDADTKKESSGGVPDLGFWHGFLASISVILVSELGDKTFFIAAIMAMRHPRLTVFTGAISALALMTVLSAVFGMAATIIPRVYTYYISTALFAIFGLKMLKEGYYMSPNEGQEEFEEVQSDLRKREDEMMRRSSDPEVRRNATQATTIESLDETAACDAVTVTQDGVQQIVASPSNGQLTKASMQSLNNLSPSASDELNETMMNSNEAVEMTPLNGGGGGVGCGLTNAKDSIVSLPNGGAAGTGGGNRLDKEVHTTLITQDPETGVIKKNRQGWRTMVGRVLMQSFTMTFLAEWGDRSQLTTIILGAREDVFGVIFGGVLGHAICTGLAVIGGRMVAQKISVRTVTIIGGVVFLIFAFSALFFDPNDEKPMQT